jgi:hypothetical protein
MACLGGRTGLSQPYSNLIRSGARVDHAQMSDRATAPVQRFDHGERAPDSKQEGETRTSSAKADKIRAITT